MFWFKKKNKIPAASLVLSADIHTHLIPDVDDGKFTSESAADTLVKMYERGARQVCLTPHIIDGLYESRPEKLKEGMQGIIKCIGDRETVPELILGAEYMVDENFRAHIEAGGDLLTLPGNHLLIEMSYYGISPQVFEVVSSLSQKGYKPVLAHPERYLYLDGQMDVFDRLYDMGCAFQLNLFSATGVYGDRSIRMIRRLFERSYYTFAGSDIHSPGQFDSIYGSYVSEKIAREGERAALWNIVA